MRDAHRSRLWAGRRLGRVLMFGTSATALVAAMVAPAGAVSTWTPTEGPVPQGAASPAVGDLAAVDCPLVTHCVAVGGYQTNADRTRVLADQDENGTWTTHFLPLPAGAAAGSGKDAWSSLSAVSCPTNEVCVAVGAYGISRGWIEPLVESLADGEWTSTAPPMPANAGVVPSPTSLDDQLSTVSCPSASSCVALGTYLDSAGNLQVLIETLSGGSWTATEGPLPANAATSGANPNASVTGLSCKAPASSVTCTAVGTYDDANGYDYGLIEQLSAGSWTATEAPEPANAGTDAGSDEQAYLLALSCSSPTACVAVGGYGNDNSGSTLLIDTLSGTAWTATEAPQPAGSDVDSGLADLSAVSCPSATACVATGQVEDPDGVEGIGVIETLSGGSWTATEAPQPTAVLTNFPGETLSAVICSSASTCVAVGDYLDTSNGQRAMIDTLSGGTWSELDAPEPANAGTDATDTQFARLNGLFCRATVCQAVGSYGQTGGQDGVLIDTY